MPLKTPESTKLTNERAFLVGIELYGQNSLLSSEDSLSELALLAHTAGLDIVGQTSQKINRYNPQTLIGQGKVEEIKIFAQENQANVIIFDEELSPRHIKELENVFGQNIKIIDRTSLILDIFAIHAATREGSLQVELAQYEYRLPRLTRAWTHLARQAGGGGGRLGSVGGFGLRGPGETQLEVDRREIRRRISHIKDELEKVRIHRKQYRTRRKKSNIPIIALVGYTNAGKSTLLNKLSQSHVYVANKLFATLDPTTRRIELPDGHPVLITDTVGFIQKLPTMLIAAFRATLEEISEADIIIHVVDITHINSKAQARSVLDTLKEIHANHIPIVTVLNKIDLLKDPEHAIHVMESFTNSTAISAKTGIGIDKLLNLLSQILFDNFTSVKVSLGYKDGGLTNLFHAQGHVKMIEKTSDAIIIHGELPGRLLAKFSPYIIEK